MFRQTVMKLLRLRVHAQRRDGGISLRFQTLTVSVPFSNSYG